LNEWREIEKTCPRWLHEQLRRLRPRRIVLSGVPGKDTVAPLLLSETDAQHVRTTSVERVHGMEKQGRIGDLRVPVLLTYAISGHTLGRWRSHPRTAHVRETIRGDMSL
jgi:hypothetical protein